MCAPLILVAAGWSATAARLSGPVRPSAHQFTRWNFMRAKRATPPKSQAIVLNENICALGKKKMQTVANATSNRAEGMLP